VSHRQDVRECKGADRAFMCVPFVCVCPIAMMYAGP